MTSVWGVWSGSGGWGGMGDWLVCGRLCFGGVRNSGLKWSDVGGVCVRLVGGVMLVGCV